MRVEELERGAVSHGPKGHGSPPVVWQGRVGGDVGRDIVPREEPDGDALVHPLHCTHACLTRHMRDTKPRVRTGIHATAVVVEPDAVRVALRRGHPTPCVARLRRGAVRPSNNIARNAELPAVRGRDRAAVAGVDRRLVVRVVVDALDDVDLAAHGPIRAVAPERWPGAAPGRHVHGVEQDEPTGVRVSGCDAHGLPISRDGRRGVDAHDGVPGRVDLGEVRGLLYAS